MAQAKTKQTDNASETPVIENNVITDGPAVPAPQPDPPKLVLVAPLNPREFVLNIAGKLSQDYKATVDAGVSFDDVLNPSYWRHVVAGGFKLRANDTILVVCKDSAWRAELFVESVGPTSMVVRERAGYASLDPGRVDAPFEGIYRIEHNPTSNRHYVERISSGEIVKLGLDSPATARHWMRANINALLH